MALETYFINYSGQRSSDFGIYPVTRPSIPTASWRATAVQIPGHDGDVYIEDGALNDIKIPITFDFRAANPTSWGGGFRALKAFLRGTAAHSVTGMQRLFFSDDPNYFYNVKRIEIGTTERVAKTIGKATVTFVCEGWAYQAAGFNAMTATSLALYNPTAYPSKPAFIVNAPDGCTFDLVYNAAEPLTFEISAGAASTIRIDTRRQLVNYTATGNSALARTTGDLDVFTIPAHASAYITITGTVSGFYFYPLWREL